MAGPGRARLKRGYLQVYTGDGKGKTTAALGLAVRAAGAGLRVYVGQFLKAARSSEHRALARFPDLVTVRRFGTPGFVRGHPTKAQLLSARRGLEQVGRVLRSGTYDLVVLDEASVAVRLGLFRAADLLRVLRARPAHVEAVVTGRGASEELLREADLVTEMREVKHYYRAGVRARRGIEM
jgi:cob(I)alamin adenosyltransferase